MLYGNYFLVNLYQEIGAAIASIISELVVMTVYICLSKQYFSIKGAITTLKNTLISTSIMATYLILIKTVLFNSLLSVCINIIVAILIYFICLVFTKEKIICEIKIINGVIKWIKRRN